MLKEINIVIDSSNVSNCVVDCFGGSAVILANIQKEFKSYVYNDTHKELYNLFKVIRDEKYELISKLKWLVISRDLHKEYVENSNNLSDVDKALRTIFLFNYSFAGDHQTSFGYRRTRKAKDSKILLEDVLKFHNKLRRWYIENQDYNDIFRRYDSNETLFIIDHPYYMSDTKHIGSNMRYDKARNEEDFSVNVKQMVDDLKGKVIMTLPDTDFYNKLYEGKYYRTETDIPYSLYKSPDKKAYFDKKEIKEMIITNYLVREV